MVEVIVVGGGPTGMMLASELRLRHVDVLVLERETEPPPFVRSLGLHVRSTRSWTSGDCWNGSWTTAGSIRSGD